MRAYSSMLSSEFIAQLRDSAIRSKTAPAVIDQIDALGSVQDLEAEVEKVGGELTDCEHARDDLRGELYDLIQSTVDNIDDIPPAFRSALKIALSALERHGLNASELASLAKDIA